MAAAGFSVQDMITMVSTGVATAMERKKRKKEGVDDLDEEEPLVPVVLAGVDGVEDDGCTKLCWPARKLPPYTGTLETFWRAQPQVIRPLRESYDTSYLRMDTVNATTTLRDHDRGAKRTIKQYAKDNIRVTKTKAIITSSGFESHDVGLANNFAECTGVYQLISALWQYTTNLFVIRRDDFSGLLMLRVLHDIKFFLPFLNSIPLTKALKDAKQVEIVQHFIDTSLAENSTRGRAGRPPLVYEESLRMARSSAGLIFSGTGTSLGLDVGLDAFGLDPYSCHGGVGATGAKAPPAATGHALQLPQQLQQQQQSAQLSKRQRQLAGAALRQQQQQQAQAAGASGAGTMARDMLCRDWNNGNCRRPTCK